MAFWNETTMEPLRQYRWYMVFGGSADLDRSQFALKKCDKPKAKVNSVQHKYLNHFYNYPGRLEWEDINITFAAINEPNMSKELYKLLTAAGYVYPKEKEERGTISKSKFITGIAQNGINLVQVGPNGTSEVLETWVIRNPFFTSVQFGALDYSSEEIVEITCTLKYDWAELLP